MTTRPECLDTCDHEGGSHGEACPWVAHERAYWARFYGQDRGTRAEQRRVLEAMAPLGRDTEHMGGDDR